MTQRNHISSLLKHHKIKIAEWCKYEGANTLAEANPHSYKVRSWYDNSLRYPARSLRIPIPHTNPAYFICLHEIAHIVLDHTDHYILDMELEAWSWALANSIRTPTIPTRKLISTCLNRHETISNLDKTKNYSRNKNKLIRLLNGNPTS